MATALSPPASNWIIDTCMYGLPTASKRPTNFAALMMFHLAVDVILPLSVIVYATATIFRVIVRTHRQIAAQANSIGGHIDLGNIPSLTSKSIRSGKDVLIICLAYLVLTILAAIYITAISVGKGNDMPAYFQFVAVWTVFCNSFVNSFFYLFLFRNVRTKVKDMLTNACTCFEFQ